MYFKAQTKDSSFVKHPLTEISWEKYVAWAMHWHMHRRVRHALHQQVWNHLSQRSLQRVWWCC